MVAPTRSGIAARVVAPRLPERPPPRRFPLIATLAPVAASVVLFVVTRSAFTLVFALLGPVVAVGSMADAALHRRRVDLRDGERLDREFAEAEAEVDRAHESERNSLDRLHPRTLALDPEHGSWRLDASPVTLRLGSGERQSALEMRVADPTSQDSRLAALRARAETLCGAPVTAELASGIGFVGPIVLARAAARASVLQASIGLSPERFRISAPSGDDWDWVAELPHPVDRTGEPGIVAFDGDDASVTIAAVSAPSQLPSGTTTRIDLAPDGTARSADESAGYRPEFVSTEFALATARALARAAERAGFTLGKIPDGVEFSSIDQPVAVGLAATIGATGDAPLAIDLVTDGPHAIVGGTTGSGKSELLATWVLAMATRRSPAVVTFLFVDFKGGAAFDPFLALPHCVGLITDLDATQALRALVSLGAELRYRERLLGERGLRAIDDARGIPPFPRLVVVVDEYAALLETHSSLHAVFADIASRGRSLGVHLVLCTQRPAGVVRDNILANCALRISLRVLTSADSTAVLGTDAAAALPARPIGRALVSSGGGATRVFQVARADESDVRAVARRWADAGRVRTPWLPPLPARVEIETLNSIEPDGSIPFALADLPEQQAQHPARYRPAEQGSLLIVGAARSGKTGALAALATAPSTVRVDALPRDLPALWDALHTARSERSESARLLLLDDLDAVVTGCDESYRAALVDLLAELIRDVPGLRLAFTVQRISGVLQPLVGLCGTHLLLRMPNRQEHVLAGGAASDFSETLGSGGGFWRGSRVQVFAAEIVPTASRPAESVLLDVAAAALTVVSTRPRSFADRLHSLAPARRVVVLTGNRLDAASQRPESAVDVAGDILVADPETWQSQWSLFGALQRSTDLVLDGCSLAEVRAIVRSRELPPPFARGERALWVRPRDGELVRARLP
jgi:S-DNA-T family DNA segregation ATPase FtsK/SpoIIIE